MKTFIKHPPPPKGTSHYIKNRIQHPCCGWPGPRCLVPAKFNLWPSHLFCCSHIIFVLKYTNLFPASEYSYLMFLRLCPHLPVVDSFLAFRFILNLSLESSSPARGARFSTPTCGHSLFLSSVLFSSCELLLFKIV